MKISEEKIKNEHNLRFGVKLGDTPLLKLKKDEWWDDWEEGLAGPYPYTIFTDADVMDEGSDWNYDLFTYNGAVIKYQEFDEAKGWGDWYRLVCLPTGFAIPEEITVLAARSIMTDSCYIYIPENVKVINSHAFDMCPDLVYLIVANAAEKARIEEHISTKSALADLLVLDINNISAEDEAYIALHDKLLDDVSELDDKGELKTNRAYVQQINQAAKSSKSFVAILCSEKTKIYLNKKLRRIDLQQGLNILTVEKYPDLVYGFRSDYFIDNPFFADVEGFLEIDLSHFDSSKIKDMSWMFCGMSTLTHVYLKDLDTSSVESMDYMFHGCDSLRFIDVSSFDTSKVKGMRCMFYGCSGLVALDLSNFNVKKVESFMDMFDLVPGVIDISNWHISEGLRDIDTGIIDHGMPETIIAKNCNKAVKNMLKDYEGLDVVD